jgi:hypothetical protein
MKKTGWSGKIQLQKRENNIIQDEHHPEGPDQHTEARGGEQQEAHGRSCPTANRNFRAQAPLFSVERQVAPGKEIINVFSINNNFPTGSHQ